MSEDQLASSVEDVQDDFDLISNHNSPSPRKRKAQLLSAKRSSDTRVAKRVKTGSTMRDGTKVCASFSNGKCTGKGKPCPNGQAHVCSRLLRNGRICGQKGHTALECHNKRGA